MAALALALVVFGSGAATASAAPLNERTPISTGHVDLIDVLYEDGELFAEVHDDSVEPSVSRPIDEVLAHVKSEAEIEVPPLPEYEFIGPGGSAAWLLPQTQDFNLLWPGWRTTSLPADTFSGDVRWRLLGVDGPGRVTLFYNGVFGEPNLIFNSADGFPAHSWIPLNSHVHANWTFGAEGVYRMIFGLEGKLDDGSTVSSGPLEYRFFVGDLADLPDESATELSIAGAKSRYGAGDEVLLTTEQSPDTGFSDYRWSRRCSNEAEFAAAGEGAALWFDATIAENGCEYRVALHDEDGGLVDVSDPVTINVGRLVLSVGHTDAVAPHYEDGELRLRVKDDTETTGEGVAYHDPADVIFHAKPESEHVITDEFHENGFGFLGPVGASSWILPEVQEPEVLWPGFSSETFPSGVVEDDRLSWHMLDLKGPGSFHLYFSDVPPPPPMFASGDGMPDTLDVNVGTHAHYNWAFGEAGLYSFLFEVDANRAADGARASSGPTLYRFFVGDLADLPEIPYAKVAVVGLEPAYAAGQTVSLAAAQTPDVGLDEYRWSRRCGEERGLTHLGTGSALSFPARSEDDGCEYFAALYTADGDPVAISSPARLSVRPAAPPLATPPTAAGGDGKESRKPAAKLNLRRATVQGRWLLVDLRLSAKARARASVKQRGKVVAGSRPRQVAPGSRSVAFKLRRKLAPGRYTVAIKLRGVAKPKAIGLWVK